MFTESNKNWGLPFIFFLVFDGYPAVKAPQIPPVIVVEKME